MVSLFVISEHNTLDMAKLRATQLKNCSRITRPQFTKNILAETKIAEFSSIVEEETNKFNQKYPIKNQPLSNLSKMEKEGVKKLKKRTGASGGEVIFTSDKSGKLSIDTLEGYNEDMAVHTDHETITEEEYKNISTLLNSHAVQWAEFMKVGSEYDHQARVHSAVVARDPQPPVVYGLRKDHKNTENDH